jgi:hypothetical protein
MAFSLRIGYERGQPREELSLVSLSQCTFPVSQSDPQTSSLLKCPAMMMYALEVQPRLA